jgi:hypothetical protein
MKNKKTLESIRQELGVTPPMGRVKGVPTFLIHSAFRLNEEQATAFIKAANKSGMGESMYLRLALMEKLEKEAHANE